MLCFWYLLPIPLYQKLEVELQQVADATLILPVNEVLTVVEAAVFVLRLRYGFALGHSNILSIQLKEDVFWGIWAVQMITNNVYNG